MHLYQTFKLEYNFISNYSSLVCFRKSPQEEGTLIIFILLLKLFHPNEHKETPSYYFFLQSIKNFPSLKQLEFEEGFNFKGYLGRKSIDINNDQINDLSYLLSSKVKEAEGRRVSTLEIQEKSESDSVLPSEYLYSFQYPHSLGEDGEVTFNFHTLKNTPNEDDPNFFGCYLSRSSEKLSPKYLETEVKVIPTFWRKPIRRPADSRKRKTKQSSTHGEERSGQGMDETRDNWEYVEEVDGIEGENENFQDYASVDSKKAGGDQEDAAYSENGLNKKEEDNSDETGAYSGREIEETPNHVPEITDIQRSEDADLNSSLKNDKAKKNEVESPQASQKPRDDRGGRTEGEVKDGDQNSKEDAGNQVGDKGSFDRNKKGILTLLSILFIVSIVFFIWKVIKRVKTKKRRVSSRVAFKLGHIGLGIDSV